MWLCGVCTLNVNGKVLCSCLCGMCSVSVCSVLLAWCVQVKRIMRGIWKMLSSTHSQSFNGCSRNQSCNHFVAHGMPCLVCCAVTCVSHRLVWPDESAMKRSCSNPETEGKAQRNLRIMVNLLPSCRRRGELWRKLVACQKVVNKPERNTRR